MHCRRNTWLMHWRCAHDALTHDAVMIDWGQYPNFSEVDFPTGDPRPELLGKLQRARDIAGIPFVITSGVRPGDPKAHGGGWAADIRCNTSADRLKMLRALMKAGFKRIGIYNKHIHVDVWPDGPPNVAWVGVSQ